MKKLIKKKRFEMDMPTTTAHLQIMQSNFYNLGSKESSRLPASDTERSSSNFMSQFLNMLPTFGN